MKLLHDAGAIQSGGKIAQNEAQPRSLPCWSRRRKDSCGLAWRSQMQQSLCRLQSCTQGEDWGGVCSRGTGTRVRCKLNRRKPFIGRNPPQSPQNPLHSPLHRREGKFLPVKGGRGELGEDNRAFPERQAMLNLEKPATAYLLVIDAHLDFLHFGSHPVSTSPLTRRGSGRSKIANAHVL
jgi:hypothetical protein